MSPSSVVRYAAGRRPTPDEAAGRLHQLALIVGDLAGAFNDIGVRRWFDRPRELLGGKTPAQLLGRNWSPDGVGPRRVRALAEGLIAASAT